MCDSVRLLFFSSSSCTTSDQVIRENPASRGTETHRQRFLSVRPGGWCRTPVNSSGTRVIRVLQTAAQWVTRPVNRSPPPIRLFSRRRKASGEHVG